MAALALALIARVALALAVRHHPLPADAADYDRHARSIAAGHGFPPTAVAAGGGPSALRPPLYPYLLGLIYRVTGNSVMAGLIGQAVLGTAIVALIALVCRGIWGDGAAALAAAIAAVYPPLIADGSTLLSEPLFVALEMGAVAAALHAGRGHSPLRWRALAGVLAGLAWLTRSTGLLLLLPLAVGSMGQRPLQLRRRLLDPFVIVIAATVVIAPWTLRNALVMHAVIPVSDQGGYTWSGTYNATSAADRKFPAAWRPATLDPLDARLVRRGRPGEVELGGRLGGAARRYAWSHPGYVFEVAYWNTRRLLDLTGGQSVRAALRSEDGLGNRAALLTEWGFGVTAVLAAAGLLTRTARAAPRWIWGIPALSALVIFTEATPRFRAPIEPFVILLAALGLRAMTGFVGLTYGRPGERPRGSPTQGRALDSGD